MSTTLREARERAGRRAAAGTGAAGALLAVTAIWGSTFLVVKDAVSRMPVLDFLGIRFLVATAVMLAVRPRCLTLLRRPDWWHGLLLGVALGLGYVFQTFGLQRTSATVAGFITGMFVVFTPLLGGLVLRRPVPRNAWVGVALATAGLALISLRGLAVGSGEALTLLSAVLFAVHIVGLGEWSAGTDPFALAVVQLAVVGVLCTASAVVGSGTLVWPPDGVAWSALLGTALFATAAAFVVQTWAQGHLAPTRAAVIMTMEPVFAGIFGVALGGERPGVRVLGGAALVVAAMYLVELGPRRGADARVPRLGESP